MVNKKLQVWLPLLFSLVMVLGMFFGYKLGNQNGGNTGFFSSNRRSTLQEALDLIKMKYVDSVYFDSLEGKAIQEMMTELDPHSVYIPPVEVKEANDDLAGNFEGIGVEFNIFRDTVNVVYVIPDGPSDKAGLKIGDKLIKVNDISLSEKILASEDIKKYIRGERGSKALLQILRGRNRQTISVTRGTIPVSSIDAAYMMDKTTGYIRLNKFSGNSYEEFMQVLESLQKQGLRSLIYDLRGNGGGFMNEAVEMADEFLEGDKLIVYTQGVNSKKREYRCKRPGLFEKGKLVILVDELSASASEVLAGALQDWCRATIIGRRTFGKGLVQEQYSLSDGSAMRLTVARYYTPLGRSIQRSYEKGKKIYMDELWERFNSGEMASADSINNHHTGKKFTNSCQDTLYNGDGIFPNVFVPFDTSLSQQTLSGLFGTAEVNSFVYSYYLENKLKIEQYNTADEYANGFNSLDLWNNLPGNVMDSFKLKNIDIKEKERIQQRLKALLARYKWRNAGYFQVLNKEDPAVKKAIEVVSK
ncbi:MAG: S41 family peptidase [Chitinophagaceae bacterium]|nr:S41 family peptidase [Chitinophagaceae bacterium]